MNNANQCIEEARRNRPLQERQTDEQVVINLCAYGLHFAVRAGSKDTSRCGGTVHVLGFGVAWAAGHVLHYPPERGAMLIYLDDIDLP